MVSFKNFRLRTLTILLIASLCACKKETPQIPPAKVTVARPLSQEVTNYDEYSGYLQSPQVVNLASRVSGVIVAAPFTEGALVQAGDVLFVIDDRPFKAQVAITQAQFALSEAEFRRFESVKGSKAVSAQEYDQTVARMKEAEAALTLAKLNLEWTKVTAPITGRVGKKLVTEGNQVNGGEGERTQLTSITSIDPIYAYVNVPERLFLKYQTIAKRTANTSVENYKLACSIQLENEANYSHNGVVDFVDNHVDPSTGTIQVRGVFPNSDRSLTPGLFAKMRIQADQSHNAILIPDQAVGSDQNTKYVLTIGADNSVQHRPVKLGTLYGKLREILTGVSKDDLVVVNGVQGARPGAIVNATEVNLAADGTIGAPVVLSSSPVKQ